MSALAFEARTPQAPVGRDADERWGDALDRLRHTLFECMSAGESPRTAFGRLLTSGWPGYLVDEPRLRWVCDTFGLDDEDMLLLVLAAAPELDPELGRLYAHHGGGRAQVPFTSALAATVLCDDATARLRLRHRLSPAQPLLRHWLLHPAVSADGYAPRAAPGAFVVDAQLLRLLCYDDGLDPWLARYCTLHEVDELGDAHIAPDPEVLDVVVWARANREAAHVELRGEPGSGRRIAAMALARAAGARLLHARLAAAADFEHGHDLLVPLLRQAWFSDALLYLDGHERLDRTTAERLFVALAADAGITLLATTPRSIPATGHGIAWRIQELHEPGGLERRRIWRSALGGQARAVRGRELDALSDRYRLGQAQIHEAVVATLGRHQAAGTAVTLDNLERAARQHVRVDPGSLARRIEPVCRWGDLILPDGVRCQLEELCARVAHRTDVIEAWGFGRKDARGTGISALFAGAPGTGKTMAAEVVAAEIGLDLLKIDLSGVVSKYIGETEKNLARIFDDARRVNAVLLFDEADALFGKRSEVRDARDRYANVEISYLLQKMEEYDGLAILSTNLKQNLDEAFLRRLTHVVLFPFPDAVQREGIWRAVWPEQTPLAPGLDLAAFADAFPLSGGGIRAAALGAAYLAAASSGVVDTVHVLRAVGRELEKVGRVLGARDLERFPGAQAALAAGDES